MIKKCGFNQQKMTFMALKMLKGKSKGNQPLRATLDKPWGKKQDEAHEPECSHVC